MNKEKIIKKGIRHWVMLSDIKTGVNWSMFESGLISDISYLLKTQRDEIIEMIEKEIIKIPKGKHQGKSWCPQCEDTGNNYACEEIIRKIKTLTK